MTRYAKDPSLFNHLDAVRKVAQKHGIDEKKAGKIINAFFGRFGILYFIRRFHQVIIPGVGKVAATGNTYRQRSLTKFRDRLKRLRWRDRTSWDRPTDY